MSERKGGTGSKSVEQPCCDSPDLGAGTVRGLDDRSLARLLKATQALSGAADLVSGLEVVADCLQRYVAYDTLGILLLDDLGKELHFALARGFPEDVAGSWRFGMGQGIVGTAAQTGEPVLVHDAGVDSRYIRATAGVRSELALPLVVKNRVIGVLDLGSASKEFFSEEHLELLKPLGTQLAIAIEGARIYQNLREQSQVLSLLHEVSRELTSILDRGRLLERVAELVGRIIEFDAFTLFFWNDEARRLEPAKSVRREGQGVCTVRSLAEGEGICGASAALRQPIRIANVHHDPRYLACVEDLEVRSELAVPLTFKERLIGVIDLESSEFDAFSARHEEALSTLGGSLSIALENSRLYERLRDNEEMLEQDLKAARGIQEQLLPKATPWVPGLRLAVAYEPARHLAGDFYDFLSYGDGRLAIAVGDVSGKSTPAALYGSMVVGMLREYTGRGRPEPATMLAEMNEKLRYLKIDSRFVALVYAVYDSEERSLTVASSGLPRPLLVRAGEVKSLPLTGMPLGLLDARTYDELKIELRPGDVVVVATDGIDEASDPEGEQLGTDRVERRARELAGSPVREIANGILETARQFSRGGDPSDDRTVLVLKAVE